MSKPKVKSISGRRIQAAGAWLVVSVLALAIPFRASAGQTPAGIAQARADSIRRPYTEADIDFMSGMIGHHAQAVKMAGWCASHGASKSLQVFCARVALGQTAEIGIMEAWLKDRNQEAPEPDPRGVKMKMNGTEMFMVMPGMLTEAQMAALDAARGVDFDRLFLTDMMQHHRGAISMVDKLLNTPGAGQDELVFKLANNIQADQITEIDRMQQMLDAL